MLYVERMEDVTAEKNEEMLSEGKETVCFDHLGGDHVTSCVTFWHSIILHQKKR